MKLLHVWISDKGCVDKTTIQNSLALQMTNKRLRDWVGG